MSKRLIAGVALVVLLVSGAFVSVQASPANGPCPSSGFMGRTTPEPMGAPGAY